MSKIRRWKPELLLTLAAGITLAAAGPAAWAKGNRVEVTQRSSEDQIRRLIEPLLDKYCPEQCKLLSVSTTVDVATPDSVAPGFDDVDTSSTASTELAPSAARIKILMDDKVGPVSRGKLIDLVQQYLETLDYPVKVDTQLAHFPAVVGAESRVAELREKIIKQFRSTMVDLFQQFCPEQCLLADFDVKTEAVNSEEAQYGSPGEFIQDGGVAIRIRDIQGTVLVDDLLSPEEQKNVLEMAKLKTNFFKNVTLASKSMHFPHPDYMTAADPVRARAPIPWPTARTPRRTSTVRWLRIRNRIPSSTPKRRTTRPRVSTPTARTSPNPAKTTSGRSISSVSRKSSGSRVETPSRPSSRNSACTA